MLKYLFLSFLFFPFTVSALEYIPTNIDTLPMFHILVINSTIIALYCVIQLLWMCIKFSKQ